ncbi:MAG: hypothetical protein E6J74_20000 [Deltaproteobacteria bacterium]|nr:MAG: hypothetical protein E6J74_20000 [Deltaproteobacteria bacterium]
MPQASRLRSVFISFGLRQETSSDEASWFCLLPNHFYLVLEPPHQTLLSQFMQWLLTSHVRRYHKHYGSRGHIWQGRFKSFSVQRDEHLMTVLRYVLQNPVRTLSETAREWHWSSLKSGRAWSLT